MKLFHIRSLCAAAVTLLVLGACGTGPSIRSFEHAEFDLSSYRTFGFHQSDAAARADRVPEFIREAISREMRGRGYQPGGDVPDLLVNFHLQTEEKDTVSTSPASYFGWRDGYHWAANPVRDEAITTYTSGTLNVDVVDRSRSELVWEAVAVGVIKDESLANPEPAVDAVIAKMFQRYPVPARMPAKPDSSSN
jgi:hypothetical protein